PVPGLILPRKLSLPGVGHVTPARGEFVPPREFRPIDAAAGSELPFRLGGQFFAGPDGISLGIAIGDMNNRVIVEAADGAARTGWSPPVRAEFEFPPLHPVAEIDLLLWWCEYQ